ncbi:MAG: ATP-dependent DNA helicase, partial [Alphaproteobacteria bacterium]|nr:ATP-dependent DNA helicase [Alphaproteobacteria bacterium]
VLAEAGTGIGKTLGYIASASVWAEKNQDTVWISTYTRNLQRQIDDELELLFPDKNKKEHRIVIRKGRENYLCLLNLEEAVGRIYTNPENAVALGLICRWALKTRNGDIAGGDFPGWLSEILGRNRILGLADRRGECVFSSCSHYKKCFIERTVRRAKNADIVVANHALVMMQAALGGLDDTVFPTRYVFDEGHHLFHAADSAFSAHLTCRETSDLRRWLIGAESSRYRTRAKGLKKRAEDIIFDNLNAIEVLNEAVYAARILPTDDWVQHVDEDSALRISEKFFALVQQQVYARTGNSSSYYSLETETSCPLEGLLKISQNFENALEDLISPLKKFVLLLKKMLDEEASELETTERQRIESLCRSIKQRAIMPLEAWQKMLQSLADKTPESFVDWFEIERKNGHNVDIGMYRHWIDPMLPFAETFAETAHGIAITSATLRDRSGDDEADWKAAEQRSGINHIYDNVSEASSYNRATIPSPFDYPAMTRVLIVNDVRKDSPEQVSAAYRELFLAANGGGLGIFTAISRLKDTYSR